LDISDEKDATVIHAAVPGVAEKELKVKIERPGILKISGHKSSRSDRKEGLWTVSESHEGSFSRRISIDSSIRASEIEAHLEHGQLVISIPKHSQRGSENEVKIINKIKE
jgi:HSP20 family protein